MDRIVKVVLRGEVGDLVGKLRATSSAVGNTANEMTKANKEAAKFRDGLSTVGSAATKAGLVATAGIGLITKAAMDWESAWTGVLKTVDGTPAQLSAIESGLRNMAKTIPVSHQELAGIAEAAGQLGVQTDSIVEFTRVMADLSATTNLTADEAATSIAQFMNVMQTAPGEVDNLGAALVALGNDGASTERDIIQMAQNIAGAGNIVGASESDILALSNALASVGIEAEAGGSSVSKILIDMSTAVSTNSKSLETWASTAGMTTAQFAESFRTSPVQAFDAFTKGLGRINAEGGDVFTLLDGLGQSDIRVTRALLGMAGAGDLLSDSLATGSREWDKNTALAEEAAKRYETTAAQVQVAWNEIKDAAIDAGAAILPVVSSVAGMVGNLAGVFGALPAPIQGATGVLALFTAGGLLAVGGIAKAFTAVSTFREGLDNLSIKAPAAGRALGFLAKGFVGVTAAATAFDFFEKWDQVDTAGVQEFTKALLDASDGSDKLLNSLTSVDASGPMGWNRNAIDGVADALHKASDALSSSDWSLGHESGLERGSKFVGQIDQALTALVASGNLTEAASAFEYLRSESGLTQKKLTEILPGYVDALAGVDVKQRIAGDSAEGLASSTSQLTEAQQEARDAARQQAEGYVSVGDAASDAEGNLDTFRETLIKQSEALRDLTKNIVEAGERGVEQGLIDKLRDAGPEGAAILAELADASESEIDRTNEAWRKGEQAVDNFTDAVDGVPDGKSVKLTVIDDAARAKLRAFSSAIYAIPGVGSPIAAVINMVSNIPRRDGGAILRAAGGSVIGPGTGTSDSIAASGPGGSNYRLSNGEHVMTAQEVDILGGQQQVYAMRAAIRARKFAMTYAGGGSVGTSTTPTGPSGYVLPPGAQFRLVGADLIELVDSRVSAGVRSQAQYEAAGRRGR